MVASGLANPSIRRSRPPRRRPIGIGKSLGRALLGWLLNGIFPIDLIWALFDRQNQRLADKILNANVYKSQLDL